MAQKIKRQAIELNQEYKSASAILRHESEDLMRQEYTIARDIIRKRINRIDQYQKAGHAKKGFYSHGHWKATPNFDFTESEFYQRFKNLPLTLRGIKNSANGDKEHELREIAKELADMKYWLRGNKATMEGMYKNASKRVKGLRQAGYRKVKLSSLHDFGKFMERYRREKLDHSVGSPTAVELYANMTEALEIPEDEVFEDFKKYAENEAKIRNIAIDAEKRKMFKGDAAALRRELFGY